VIFGVHEQILDPRDGFKVKTVKNPPGQANSQPPSTLISYCCHSHEIGIYAIRFRIHAKFKPLFGNIFVGAVNQ